MLTSLLTTTYFKKVLSLRLRRGEKKNVAKSRREEALCIPFSLIAFFFPSLHDATSDRGSADVGSAYSYRFLLRTMKPAQLEPGGMKELKKAERDCGGARLKRGHDCCPEHCSGTCHLRGIRSCPFLFLF